jgi:shikimate kinase
MVVISVGGGVVDWLPSVECLRSARSVPKIYIEKELKNLKIDINGNRPYIPNFAEVVKVRSKKYE